jgi:N-acetyl-gamma-glutamyl-phosphate reductase
MSIRVAILGASGYSGEELVRLLLRHPEAKLACVTSRQNAGKTLAEVFPKFASDPLSKDLTFIEPKLDRVLKEIGSKESSVVFLALPHGVASDWALPLVEKGYRVIDLSADFRLRDASVYQEFYGTTHPAPELLKKAVYGLPEIYRKSIQKSRFIASPGCYPTSILLPLIPLLKAKLIKPQGIIVNSLSGVSGAGRKSEEVFLFCECNESVRPYGVPKHRHLSEIEQELSIVAGDKVTIQFTPHLIPLNRGILTSIYARPEEKSKDIGSAVQQCYAQAYGKEPFVRLLRDNTLPDTKNVTSTNCIEIAHRYDMRTGRLLIFSAEDNLTKGAAGQAVQSMNIMCGFSETAGLL